MAKMRIIIIVTYVKILDSDLGVGLLTKETSETLNAFPNDSKSWEFFYENRQEILDLVTVDEFINLYPVNLLVD